MRETFQQFLEELKNLAAEVEPTTPSEQVEKRHGLLSEFEIESRPGMRPTKISQKLRQEKDRANMTSKDEEYTKLVNNINIYVKDILSYLSDNSLSDIVLSPSKQKSHYTKSFISILLKLMLMYPPPFGVLT